MKKFSWIERKVMYGCSKETPESLALLADERAFDRQNFESYSVKKNKDAIDTVQYKVKDTEYDDYKDFTWRDLYHKLCFE